MCGWGPSHNLPNAVGEVASVDFMEQLRGFSVPFRIDADAAAAQCVGHLGAAGNKATS